MLFLKNLFGKNNNAENKVVEQKVSENVIINDMYKEVVATNKVIYNKGIKNEDNNNLDDIDVIKFYDDITENYSIIRFSLSLFTKNLNMLITAFNILKINISNSDIADIFIEILAKTNDLAYIRDYRNVLNRSEIQRLFYFYYKKYANNRNKNSEMFRQFNERFITEHYLDVLSTGFSGDLSQGSANVLDSLLDIFKNSNFNDNDDITKNEIVTFYNCIIMIVTMVKIIKLQKYIKTALFNVEFKAIIDKYDAGNINDIYEVYNQYYRFVFPETFCLSDLELLICLCRKYNDDYIYIIKNLIDLIGINMDGIINESKDELVYNHLKDIIENPEFEILINKRSFESVILDSIPYYTAYKLSIKQWLINMFDWENCVDKVNSLYKKNSLINKPITSIQQIMIEKYKNIQTGEEFERFLKQLYESLGFIVSLTPTTGDQGADLVIEKNEIKTVVQAKFYNCTVGNTAVQEVVGAIKYYNADRGVVVSNSTYTNSAIDLAKANNIELVDGKSLLSIVNTLL